MSRGASDIAMLKLEVLQGFVTKWTNVPDMSLANLLSSSDSPSSKIKWESYEGSRGMTPFVPPGSPAPVTSGLGAAEHEAEAAYWKEKRYFDEEFLNNLKKPGTESTHMEAKQKLAQELGDMVNRCMRRRQWMVSQMFFSGAFNYSTKGGVKISMNYSIPTAHNVALTAPYQWNTGTSRDIWQNIIDGKRVISDACGAKADLCICNSKVLGYLAKDPVIQTLLQKSAFGSGDLFKGSVDKIIGANPDVIASLLGLGKLMVFDEKYEVRAYLTAVVTASSTTAIAVEDTADFEVGGTLRFHDVSEGTWEDETISAVSAEAGTVTVSAAPSTSYRAGEDYVSMVKGYVPDDKFLMMATKVDGKPIAQFKKAPYGNNRTYGLRTTRKDEWDPEGIWIRVEDKGLPILFQRDALYILDVA